MTEQIINITIDDLINGNLRDMELTAQFGVYRQAVKGLAEKLDQLKEENEKLKNNITSFDYLDSLTNEQVAVLYTASIDELAIRGYKAKYNTEVSLLTRYKQALTEIKQIVETCNSCIICSECPYTGECKTGMEGEALAVCKLIQQKLEVLGDI